MKDNILRKIIFGKTVDIEEPKSRGISMTIPAKDEDDRERSIYFAADDGLFLYLLKRIEKLEEKVEAKRK